MCKVFVETLILEEGCPVSIKYCLTLGDCGHRMDGGFRFKALCEMLSDHTAKVVECFSKVTGGSKKDNLYIQTEEAKAILKAGLNSTDERVCQQAVQAPENLLRERRFDLLDLED